jgi:hypothetical protein
MTVGAPEQILDLASRLVARDKPRSEANVQADVRSLLLLGALNLDDEQVVNLETQAGQRRRIDVEVGYTVIEVKRDLRPGNIRKDAEVQLAGYVRSREEQTGQRYVGVLTDGAQWIAFHLRDDQLVEVAAHELRAGRNLNPDDLLVWLEGVLATRQGIVPTTLEIERRLGADSPSHALDLASLAGFYQANADLPTVKLKRELWAKLLRSALGTQFEDTDGLFLEHTLLVNSAEVIAHSVLGFDVATLNPATLLAGQRFEQAGISGVVESDFFDWVLEIPGGAAFVQTLARRLGRFDWGDVDHDVLKALYESVIRTEVRKKLGEYYTPDWLAEHIVTTVVTDPLDQRVLDPSCGSGTFVFHAVQRYLTAAEDRGIPLAGALAGLSTHVSGIDLHPVAVALARVTYLLAIGRTRLLDPTRGPINVPVYLGDSLQWPQQDEATDLFSDDSLVISTNTGAQLYSGQLTFPESLLADAARFDGLVTTLADMAASPDRKPGKTPSLVALFRRLAISVDDQQQIVETFEQMCRLHDDGRDHIWGYYIRNLARPAWLARKENRVDVLVGNPPWLSYRHMSSDMQKTFRAMSAERGLWYGAESATQQDLSGLFVVRAIEQYLKVGGQFGFVFPNPVLDRTYFAGFRSGRYATRTAVTEVAFTPSWDLRRLRPHFFPRGSAVVFGSCVPDDSAIPMPTIAEQWTGHLPGTNATWQKAVTAVTRTTAELVTGELDSSPYAAKFTNGATIFPRLLFFVEEAPASPLGYAAGSREVRSTRSSTEKLPWKEIDRLEGVVETEFLRPVYLGENVLPYKVLTPRTAVLPIESSRLIADEADNRMEFYPGLARWWNRARRTWEANRRNDRLSLAGRLDFHKGLTAQIPPAPRRVLYSKSGMHISAAVIADPRGVVENTLYWGAVETDDEGLYLVGILNSPSVTELVRPLMSYGKDERHIDKAVWRLPIPAYNPDDPRHAEIAYLAGQVSAEVANQPLPERVNFVVARRIIRKLIAESQPAQDLDQAVAALLGAP